MVSTRERAGAAMAALDRRNPNLDDFAGLHWSDWVDRSNISSLEEGSDLEEWSKYGKKPIEAMTLMNEDMPIYGHCPAHDEFYLVVCSHCGQVVKPQAFENHCDRRHSVLIKPCSQPSTLAPQQRPRPGRPPPAASSTRDRQKDSMYQEEGSHLPTSAVPQHKPAKTQKEAVSLLPMEICPQKTPPSPLHPSTPCPRVSPWQVKSRPTSSSSTSPSAKHSLPRPVTVQLDDPQCPPVRGLRTYSCTYKKVYKKECDLDKHCGVLDPERKKLCTRQLMCNIHSIHQRRKVPGRSKSFDQLVMEQRAGSTGCDLERHPVSRDPHTPKHTATQHSEGPEEISAAQHGKHNLGSSCSVLSRSRESLESGPEEDCDGAVDVKVQPPYPFNQSLLSSEESEDEEQAEARDLPATPWHPKPLGLCTFGSRTFGSSIFTFDRRLHHLRFALSAMVEQHINAQLWKKIPQVTSGLRSHHASTITTGPSVRTGARVFTPIGSSTLCPTSSGIPETKSNQCIYPFSKPHSPTLSPARLGPGHPRSPIGRPIKTQPRDLEPLQAAATAQKATMLLHGSEDQQSSKHIRDNNFNKKGQPHSYGRVYPSISSQGFINDSLGQGKKPYSSRPPTASERPAGGLGKCSSFPTPHCPPYFSPRSRGRSPGVQKTVSYDRRGVAQKRKIAMLSPALPRSPKSNCLSSPSHSRLLPWKGESVGGVLARGLEKRLDP